MGAQNFELPDLDALERHRGHQPDPSAQQEYVRLGDMTFVLA